MTPKSARLVESLSAADDEDDDVAVIAVLEDVAIDGAPASERGTLFGAVFLMIHGCCSTRSSVKRSEGLYTSSCRYTRSSTETRGEIIIIISIIIWPSFHRVVRNSVRVKHTFLIKSCASREMVLGIV